MTQPALPPSISIFDRSCSVQVGSVLVQDIGKKTGLDVWFQVRKSLKPRTPNTCDLRLYNLSDATRRAIEQAAQPMPPGGGTAPGADATATPVTITAGYVGATSVIFQGALRSAQTVQDGPDTVTELQTGDGDDAAILARSSYHFGRGASAYQVALQILGDMGCGVGNLQSAAIKSVLQAAPGYRSGVTLKGSSYELLSDLAASCGLEVTLQRGVPQWLLAGEPLPGQAYLLATTPQNTGVLGSPSVDTKGVLSIDTLMFPGLVVGNPVAVKTAYLSGAFRICSAEWTGDTRGNDWQVALECKRPGIAP